MTKDRKIKNDTDIRVFRRYSREASFTIRIGGEAFSSNTLNYSLEGLGVSMKKPFPLEKEDVVDLHIDDLNIRQIGKIMWIKEGDSTITAGIQRIGPLHGSFSHFRLSDILIGLQRTLRTGILDIRQGLIHKKVYIKNGDMIFSTSNQVEDRLGDILLKEGRLTREQYEQAQERKKKTDERYVLILVDSGFLNPSELLNAIELQATRIIESIFALQKGDFVFVEGPLPTETAVTLQLPAANLAYRELKKRANTDLFKKDRSSCVMDF